MSEQTETQLLRGRPVTLPEALDAAQRFIDDHFKNPGKPRVNTRIPAQVSDHDIVLMDYLRESAALQARAEAAERERDAARAEAQQLREAIKRDADEWNKSYMEQLNRALDAEAEVARLAGTQEQMIAALQKGLHKAVGYLEDAIDNRTDGRFVMGYDVQSAAHNRAATAEQELLSQANDLLLEALIRDPKQGTFDGEGVFTRRVRLWKEKYAALTSPTTKEAQDEC